MILLLSILTCGIVGWLSYVYWWTPGSKTYMQKLAAMQPGIGRGFPGEEDLVARIGEYEKIHTNSLIIDQKVRNMPFPNKPQPVQGADSGMAMQGLVELIDSNSLYFAGIEQMVFIVFPPDQMADCMVNVLETIGYHSGQVAADGYTALQASIQEGLHNVQHHPELLLNSLKNVLTSVKDHLKVHDNYEQFLHHLGNHHYLEAFSPIAKPWTIFYNWMDPIMHTQQHTHEVIGSAISHAGQSVHAVGDHFVAIHHIHAAGHFPFMTLIFSGVREFRLLQDDKTNLGHSLKNISLDVAGSFVGAVAGGKGGALAGSAIFPGPGTLIGGIVGAIGGAILARFGTDKIKKANLKAAIEAYEKGYSRMMGAIGAIVNEAVIAVEATIGKSQTSYLEDIGPAPLFSADKTELSAIADRLAGQLRMDVEKARSDIRAMRSSIFANAESRRLIQAAEEELSRIEREIPAGSSIQNDPAGALHVLRQIPYILEGGYKKLLESSGEQLRTINADQKNRLFLWAVNAAMIYKSALHAIVEEVRSHSLRYNKGCAEARVYLAGLIGTINTEKERLGLH